MRFTVFVFLSVLGFFSLQSATAADSSNVSQSVIKTLHSTVTVTPLVVIGGNPENNIYFSGTGIILNKEGYILTSYHIAKDLIELSKKSSMYSLSYTISLPELR